MNIFPNDDIRLLFRKRQQFVHFVDQTIKVIVSRFFRRSPLFLLNYGFIVIIAPVWANLLP
ncbi:hypothetical protein SD37_09225 [Amycolatopsis orientalis]|uniref:Uncharacterized protein n=1 Tax=Amycolatopsis orientalis TaxID=31958 RepID=A0A193BUG5_AMYOR|nr:hypothetical protein SD37_09225 [Amycolatopsis orientalis]